MSHSRFHRPAPPRAPRAPERPSKRQGGNPHDAMPKAVSKGKKTGGYGGMSSSTYGDLGLLDHFGDKVYIRAKLKKRSGRS